MSTRYRTNYYYDRRSGINGGVDKSFIERKPDIELRKKFSIDNYRDYDRVRSERGDRYMLIVHQRKKLIMIVQINLKFGAEKIVQQ